MKAVFNRPEKPSPRPRSFEISLSPQTHQLRDPYQLAPAVAFLHLAIDQTCLHLPPEYVAPSTSHFSPLAKMGREAHKSTYSNHHW